MKKVITLGDRDRAAFTLLEMLFVILILGILAVLLLPSVEKSRARSKQVNCGSGLRQLGVAFHLFAHDHQNQFPFQVSTNAGGTLEFVPTAAYVGDDFTLAYRHFQPLSNDLSDARLLACVSDRQRTPAEDFLELRNRNISYVLGISAAYPDPDSVLSGDRNILRDGQLLGAVTTIREGSNLDWTRQTHESRGNLLFADGRVQGMAAPGLSRALARRTGSRLINPVVSRTDESVASSGGGGGGGSGRNAGGGGSPGDTALANAPGGSSGFALLQKAFGTSPGTPTPSGTPSVPSGGGTKEGAFALGGLARVDGEAPTSGPPDSARIPELGVEAVAAGKPIPTVVPLASATDMVMSPENKEQVEMALMVGEVMEDSGACWACWLLILIGVLAGLVVLAYAIRFRNIRLRRRTLAARILG